MAVGIGDMEEALAPFRVAELMATMRAIKSS
jgi:hypothetical protein